MSCRLEMQEGGASMMRMEHQPSDEPVVRKKRGQNELRVECGGSIGFVLALETGTTPLVVQFDDPEMKPVVCAPAEGGDPVARPLQLFDGRPAVCWTLEACCQAQMAAVYVIAADEIAERVRDALAADDFDRRGVDVRVVASGSAALVERTAALANFKMFDLSSGVITLVRDLAEEAPESYENVVVLSADNVRVTAEHLYELCADAHEHPEAEVVSSWIAWLRRPPYLFTRDFLLSLEDRGLTAVGANGCDRDVPRLAVRDHVFGEEKLAASPVAVKSVDDFLAGCELSALEAVALARWSLAHPAEKLVSPKSGKSLMGPVAVRPLGASDIVLVDIAKDVLQNRESYANSADLAWADRFGKRCRMDFPLLNDRAHTGKLAYLDTAATSQRVDVALQAQRDYDEHENANVYRGGYALSAQSTFTFNDARARLEGFIGAQRREIVYTANTTGATNLVAQAWGEWNVGKGDLIVVTLEAHHSNMLPFMMLAQRKGAQLVYVPYGPDGRLDLDAYAEALSRHPKLVCLAHVGNVFGIAAPIEELARKAHDAGARVLVDAAQSFAHRKIDVSSLGADWVAVSAHKAYGPMGIGALWVSPDVFDEMDPLGGGGGTVSHVGIDSYYLRPKAIQYEMGTPPVSQAVGWAAAIDYLDKVGMDDVARHDAVMTDYLVDGLHRIDGVDVMGDHSGADGKTGLVSFTLRSLVPASLAAFAGKLGVAIRSGGHCALPLHASMGLIGTGRISFGVYTTADDVDAALVAIEACRRAYEGDTV